MKKTIVFILVFLVFAFVNRSFGQDVCKTNPKYCKMLSDTAGIRMIMITLPPGAKLVTHSHPVSFGYVIKGGLFKWTYIKTGKTESVEMKPGDSYHGPEDPPHYSWNAGKTTIQFILIEKYK